MLCLWVSPFGIKQKKMHGNREVLPGLANKRRTFSYSVAEWNVFHCPNEWDLAIGPVDSWTFLWAGEWWRGLRTLWGGWQEQAGLLCHRRPSLVPMHYPGHPGKSNPYSVLLEATGFPSHWLRLERLGLLGIPLIWSANVINWMNSQTNLVFQDEFGCKWKIKSQSHMRASRIRS